MRQSYELIELIADIRERVKYMSEIGVTSLDVNLPEKVMSAGLPREAASSPAPDQFQISNRDLRTEILKPPEKRAAGQSRLASLPSLSKRNVSLPARDMATSKLSAVDKEMQNLKTEKAIENKGMPANTAPALLEPIETIEQIRAEIGPDCTRCKLGTLGRSKVVNSVGNFNAELMFVGEAPGADEDIQGEPFVGRAGQLLTKIIESIGMRREDVFIGNINRCRPPDNRRPEPDESVACRPFLLREVAVIRPKVIVVLGAHAAQNLLETKEPIGKLRGQFHDYLGVKVMPTFHPAYLLRDPHKKREVWDDLKMVRDFLKGKG